ncbi:MAG: GDSL-type esterase/lipase family protein, partial [Pseudomonadota bacterium]
MATPMMATILTAFRSSDLVRRPRGVPAAAGYAILGLAVLSAMSAPAPVLAQAISRDLPTNSYLTPFPEGNVYRLRVFGDSMSEGLQRALKYVFSGDALVRVAPGRTAVKSLTSSSWSRVVLSIERGSPPSPMPIAVVMTGTFDQASVRQPGKNRIRLGTEAWRRAYSARVGRMMTALKARKAGVYWVGLPVMRREAASGHARLVNEIVRERALRNGIKFIDIYENFTDGNGRYSPYGPDLDGKVRSLRWRDGIHFTSAGYAKIAHFVKREIVRDLRQARAERMVELRGKPAEVKRLQPKADEKKSDQRSWTSLITGRRQPIGPQAKGKAAAKGAAGRGLKAETVTVTVPSAAEGAAKSRALKLKIVRPAVAPSIVALVTRRSSPDQGVQLGEAMPLSSKSGPAVMGTVTPASSSAITVVRKKTTPTQLPFFKVWDK